MTTPRIALWDNARFLAITLVVLGHSLTKMVPETDSAFVLYVSIYLFHIPLFVFLSGYFASATAPTLARIQSVLVDLLIPYLLLEAIWSLVHSIQAGQVLFNPLRPSWTLWFLLSLAAWRILLPYLAQVPMPLFLSIVVATLSGYWSVDQTLSLSRTLAFLPFFVLGWKVRGWGLGDRWLALPAQSVLRTRVLALALFGGVITTVAFTEDLLRLVGVRKLLTADTSYLVAGFDQWYSGGFRVILFLLATALVWAFIVLTPRNQTWFSSFGGRTMTIYVVHSFILAPLRATDVLSGEAAWWHLSLVVIGSVGLSIVLAQPFVHRFFRPVTHPSWAIKTAPKPGTKMG